MAFADLPKDRNSQAGDTLAPTSSTAPCNENGIEHKLTKPYHPWTNGQVERMNRTVKEATIKAFHQPDLESLKAHALAFVSAYNLAKHLKTIGVVVPFPKRRLYNAYNRPCVAGSARARGGTATPPLASVGGHPS